MERFRACGFERARLDDIVVRSSRVLLFEGEENELCHSRKILDFIIAARFVHASMPPRKDRYAERKSRRKGTDRYKMLRFGDDALAGLNLLFEHIAHIASLVGAMVLSHPVFDSLNVVGDKIGADQLAMGMDQGRSRVRAVILENHRITHVGVGPPVIQSLAVRLEHQHRMLWRQPGNTADMIGRLDDDFVSPLRLTFLEKLARCVFLVLG